MIKFEVENIRKDPESICLKDKWELLINIEGDLKVYLDGSLYFDEPMTIVELAVELKKWLTMREGTSFKFDTMDDDEENIFNIVALADRKYQFNSAWQKISCSKLFSRTEVESFVIGYVNCIVSGVQQKLKVNLSEIGL